MKKSTKLLGIRATGTETKAMQTKMPHAKKPELRDTLELLDLPTMHGLLR